MTSDESRGLGPPLLAEIAYGLLTGPVAVVACRADWTVAWANAAAVRLLGADPARRPLADLVDGGVEALAAGANAGSPVSFRRAGGTPFRAFTAVGEGTAGRIVQIFEADDYVRARDMLAYQESIWRHAIEAAEHGVWDYNANNEGQFYSDAWKSMRGFPLDQEVEDSNQAWEARLHPDDLESVREHVRQQNSGEIDHFNFEYRERRVDDGRWIWILARGKTVEWDAQGRPTRLIGTDIDITSLKEEEAKRAAEIEATYQQHLAELEKANRAAEAARAAADALARLDPLSNLANRRAFAEEIERLSSDTAATPAFAVLLIDLDRFKPINDMHGHAVGDMVIRESAQRLRASVGTDGMVARLGGDEFGVILRAAETEIAAMAGTCAETLIAELSRPIVVGDFAVEIGASIGLATFPTHSRNADTLFRYADMALYEAKHTARGSWSRYSRSLGQLAESRAVMETEVRRAVAREEIQPHFQPIVDMQTGKVVKLEMLARWPHPVRGSVPPDRFIPIVEHLGLINEFTLSMLRRTCMAAKEWPADIAVSINLTTREICDLTTPLKLLDVAAACAFPAERLEVEITEKALVKDIGAARQVIAALRIAGVKVMLDDFGAGYSGLGYLRELAFDCIKIDRSFIANLCRQEESRKIVRAIQSLAESLDLATVAEGIEDQDICEVVKQISCTWGQGFYFSRPVPAADVPALLNRTPQLRLAG